MTFSSWWMTRTAKVYSAKAGAALVDHFGLHGKVDIEVGTMSKAFGVVGGMVAGDKVIIEWLRQRGRPFLFLRGHRPGRGSLSCGC